MSQRPLVGKRIRGIATGLNQLFVLQQLSFEIQVFDKQTLKKQQCIAKPQLFDPWDIIESSGYFYVSEKDQAIVHKFTVKDWWRADWNVLGTSATLSASPNGNILASFASKNTIVEYTKTGKSLFAIILGNQLISPSHAILLRTGEYIVCDVMGDEHRIVKLNSSGYVIREYGRLSQLGKKPLKMPRYLIECGTNYIMIADQDNSRILLMNSNLELIKELVLPKHDLNKPFQMSLDRPSGRLFVAEQGQKILKIFNFLSSPSQNRV